MKGRVSGRTSSVVYAIIIVGLVVVLAMGLSFFRKSPIAMMLGGFIGSLLFFFLFVFIGHINELRGKKVKPGLLPTVIVLVLCYACCLIVHPFCFLFCVAYSVPMVTYMSQAAHMVRPGDDETPKMKQD